MVIPNVSRVNTFSQTFSRQPKPLAPLFTSLFPYVNVYQWRMRKYLNERRQQRNNLPLIYRGQENDPDTRNEISVNLIEDVMFSDESLAQNGLKKNHQQRKAPTGELNQPMQQGSYNVNKNVRNIKPLAKKLSSENNRATALDDRKDETDNDDTIFTPNVDFIPSEGKIDEGGVFGQSPTNKKMETRGNEIKKLDNGHDVSGVTSSDEVIIRHIQPDKYKEPLLNKAIPQKNRLRRPMYQPSTVNEKVYNSYNQFNPDQFEEKSPQWQMAMIRYLLDMKIHGHKIQEVATNMVIIHVIMFR